MSVVFLGAGGRLGQLLKPRWPGSAVWATRADVDIDDPQGLATALADAETVFCLAGVTPGASQPMENNPRLAQQVLDAAWHLGGRRVVLFSTAAVYGAQPDPLTEHGPTSPQSAYGRSKLKMEDVAVRHPNPSTCLRLGNVAGADAILGNWRQGFTLDTFADGTTPERSYIGPTCLARVLFTIANSDNLPDIVNVSAPGAVAMGDLLNAAQLDWTSRPATEATIARVALETGLLERFVTFSPNDSTAAGIVADWRGQSMT